MLIEQHLDSVKLRFKWRRLISAAVKDARAELLAKKGAYEKLYNSQFNHE